jgi:uncharacterized membrane protein YhaH (DUF805 family)
MDYIWFLFSFEGRINRAKFWWAGLTIVCWMLLLAALMFAVAGAFGIARNKSFGFGTDDIFGILDPASLRSLSSADVLPLCFKAVGTPLFLWVYVAASIKRLHDRDKSAWWVVPFFVVPGLFHQFEDRLGDSYPALFLSLIVSAVWLWGVIEIFLLRGTKGPNRFGPDLLALLASRDTRPRWDQQTELEFVPHSAGPSPASHGKRGA